MNSKLAAVIATTACLALPATAPAAITIGADVGASQIPTAGCATATCTATNLAKPAGGNDIVAPSDGVVVRFRIKHAAFNAGTPQFSVKVLSGTGSIGADDKTPFTVVAQTGMIPFRAESGTDEVPTVDASGRGLPIRSLQRVGVYVNSDQVLFQRFPVPGYTLAESDGDHATGTRSYDVFASAEALINADIQPDADRDGYGDETYDRCPSAPGPGQCPPRTGGGTIRPELVTSLLPPNYVKPRIGRLVRVRRPLSSLSRRPLSVPIACYGACSAQGALVTGNIRRAILRRYGFSSRSVVVGRGRARSRRGGKFTLKVRLSRNGKRLLRGLRRDSRLTLKTTVSDRWRKASRRQKLIVTR